ncbi:hypothetical protein BH11BAC5_BH11BAC5_42110 [soil metagenome]
MKSTFILLLGISISTTMQAQNQDSIKIASVNNVQLLSKSKIQKTVGWTIFGTGIPVVLFTGYFLATSNKNDIDKSTLTTVFIAGTLYTLISIPLIRAGRLNKKRALSVSIIDNKVATPYFYSFVVKSQPSISVHIPFN